MKTLARPLAAALAMFAFACAAAAGTVRVAAYNAELHRDGPGLLLRDITGGKDPQVNAVVEVIGRIRPDVLALQGIDWDADNRAVAALADRLASSGVDYPFVFAAQPNSGFASGLDLDGDGRLGEPEDSLGYGAFSGQNGMAILSRFRIDRAGIRSFTGMRWKDLPGALLPERPDGSPFPSTRVRDMVPLSTTAHWVVPVFLPDGKRMTILTYSAGPPVFDGPEDFNGRRNHDETRFWTLFLDGAFGGAPDKRFVLAGSANVDPTDGDGLHDALNQLLRDPRLSDPEPRSKGAAAAPDQGHRGANALDTVDWASPGPGRLRVDYVLPSADLGVARAGVFWPAPGQLGHEAALAASRHRLVWADLIVTPAP